MLNLTTAKFTLKGENLTLVVVKRGKVIFKTKSPGIIGLLQAIEALNEKIVASSVADKVVGRAAALLCAYSRVSSVFAVTISEEAKRVLEDHNILYQFENQVLNILNNERSRICPFEKLTAGVTNPLEAYEKLKSAVHPNF